MYRYFTKAKPARLLLSAIFVASFAVPALAQPVKIMPLGNSITWGTQNGQNLPNDTGYRDDLDALLSSEGVSFDFVGSQSTGSGPFDPNHEGHPGFHADEIFANINTYLGAKPDVILLHIGTNDISSSQTNASTRNEIQDIIDAIDTFNPNIKIVLASLIPRTDTKDTDTSALNALIEDLYYTKRDAGFNVYYAGMNELFKQDPNWATDYYNAGDSVHPNDAGYNVIANVFFNSLMTALNSGSATITDNFQRSSLGITWAADPEVALQNGELVNIGTSGGGSWIHMATFRGIRNPSSVAIKWASNADAAGINQGGLALLLDAPTATADGYLAWITLPDNMIRLWTISNGNSGSDMNLEQPSQASAPGPGDVFSVDITISGTSLQFDYFVNGVFAGNITAPNPGGLSTELYSGVLVKDNLNNNVDEFTLRKTSDTTPPDPVLNLATGTPTATSVPLTWTATGDDGSSGQASSYDLRYSTQIIDNSNFSTATPVSGVPGPSPANSIENFTVSGLQAGTQFFFALKVIDEAGNSSTLSNVVTATTVAGNFFKDDFNRATLDNQWSADPDYAIVNNELANTSASGSWNELAILNARKNPNEVSFTWGATADAAGIDQAGFALVFGSASPTSSGYAVTRRTGANNEIRLWEIVNGSMTNVLDRNQSPNLSPPAAGDVVKIVISSSGASNKFEFFKNGQFDGAVQDVNFLYTLSDDNWAGVALRANNNNAIDDFTLLLQVGAAANMIALSGNAQTDTVGQQLPTPLTVRVTDAAGSPVSGFNVNFEVTVGGGSVDVAPPRQEIVIEAEQATLTAPMVKASDANASGSSFIEVPDGTGGQGAGKAAYTIQITDPGNYIMWGRAIYPNANSDAFFINMDGTEYMWDIGQRVSQSNWTWDAVSHRGTGSATNPELDPVVFNLTAGAHTLLIKEGKDGAQLDQFVIVKESSGFQPPIDQSAITPGGTFTNASGEASTHLTLGPTPGTASNQVRAFGNGVPDIVFTANSTPGTVTSITKVSGIGQVGDPGQTLTLPFVVEVKDAFGNLAVGTQTTWTLLGGGNGTLSAGAQVAVDANGRASNTLTMSTNIGTNQVQVSSPGYTGPDVIFTANSNPGAAAVLSLVSGTPQTGTASTPLGAPFVVKVVDNIGTPVPNQSVLFKVIAGGGSFAGASEVTVQTGTDGTASATLKLGPSPGSTNQAQAIVTGLSGSPVTFTATSAEPLSVSPVSAISQSGTASVQLPDSIGVLVKDTFGNPLPNYPVEFSVTLGGGSVNESPTPVTVSTNSQGVANVEWRLGPNAGVNNNKLQASATFNGNNLTGSPIVFTASAAVGDAANLVEVSGNNQSGLVETDLSQPFVVKVTDASNNPVVGWPVTFSIQAGGGDFGGKPTVLASTNNAGEASATLTLGSAAGTPANPFNNKVVASAQNNGQELSGSPITFQASAIATGARDLLLISGNNQTGQAGLALPEQVKVKVTDGANGNPIPNHTVTFRVTGGGGTLNGPTSQLRQVLTDNTGIAAISWYMGGVLGANKQTLQVTATDGINNLTNSPMAFQATAVAGPVDASASSIVSDVTAVQANGQDVANLTVTLSDKFGNPIPGEAVTFTSTGSNNDITQPIEPTNAAGQAFGSIASIKAEAKSVGARDILAGITLASPVTVTFLSQPPERVELSKGNNQRANVGTAVPQPIEVLVADNFNNPVAGVRIEFEVLSGGGYIAQTNSIASGTPEVLAKQATTTDADGKAWAVWVLGASAGTNTAHARAFFNGGELQGSPVRFTAEGLNASATTLAVQGGNEQTTAAGIALPEPFSVLVADAQERPVAGVPVNFSVQLGGGKLSKTNTVTGFDGIARTWLTLGPTVGKNVVDAASSGLVPSTVTFTADGVVGPPAKFVRFEGDNTEATVSTVHNITVLVTDFFDNPRAGVPVAFQVIQGGGAITGSDRTTDAAGLARAQIRMPDVVEEVLIKVTSAELPGFFTVFRVRSVSGSAMNLIEEGGNNQEGTVGRKLVEPLAVKVTDQFGNPVSGQEVQWVRTIGGGSVSEATTFTDAQGLARTEFTLGQLGENQALAIASQLTPGQLTFTATGVSNNFPLFTGLADMEVTEGTLLQFQLTAADADNDPLTFEAQNVPNGATFTASSATFSWTPNQTQQGSYEVTFVVRDNRGGLDSKTITITVNNSNNPPVVATHTPAQFDGLTFKKGDVIRFSVTASDPDPGDIISYNWRIFSDNIPNGQLLSTSPGFDFVTDHFEPASYQIKLDVTDGHDTVSLQWNVGLTIVSVELASFNGSFDGFDGAKIVWQTTRETDNTGFNVLRGTRRDGEYQKVNAEKIPTDGSGSYTFVDKKVTAGKRYYYMLEDVNIDGVKSQHGPIELFVAAPKTFELSQNYPNPFNPTTNIRFQIPKAGHVKVQIFDILGREVRTLIDRDLTADYHVVTWNARDDRGIRVGSGMYFYQVVTAGHRETKKMLLVK